MQLKQLRSGTSGSNYTVQKLLLLLLACLLPAACSTTKEVVRPNKQTLHYQYDQALDELASKLVSSYSGAKLRLAITPLVNSDNKRSRLGVEIADSLHEKLFNNGKFILLERSRIDSLLKEHQLQQQGVVQTSAEIGSMLGADLVLVGTIGHSGSSFTLNGRIVSFGPGEVKAVGKSKLYAKVGLYQKYEEIVGE